MNPSSCMYGAAHVGDAVAVRSKVGRTVGWLCVQHFELHERELLNNGYHFRTTQEMIARGELDGGESTPRTGGTDVAEIPAPEQQQLGSDGASGDSEAIKLAHGGSLRCDARGGSHGSTTTRLVESPNRGNAGWQAGPAQKELETRAAGTPARDARVENGERPPTGRGELDWPAWTDGAGHLTLTEQQREILQSPFADSDITIRYDGVVYVPWRKYWSRMYQAFAPYVPSVIPIDNPKVQGQEIIVGVVMVCAGQFIGKAWGSHRLEGQNDRMAYGDRIESAISDAIAKIGKRLNMGEDLWDEEFRAYWVSQYAEQYTNRGRTSWRRKPLLPAENADDQMPDFNDDARS